MSELKQELLNFWRICGKYLETVRENLKRGDRNRVVN